MVPLLGFATILGIFRVYGLSLAWVSKGGTPRNNLGLHTMSPCPFFTTQGPLCCPSPMPVHQSLTTDSLFVQHFHPSRDCLFVIPFYPRDRLLNSHSSLAT